MKFLILSLVCLGLSVTAHAQLSELQKRQLVEAIKQNKLEVLDNLSADVGFEQSVQNVNLDEPAPVLIPISSVDVDGPGEYKIGGVNDVHISKRACNRGFKITVPTCPEPYHVKCGY